MNPLEQAVKDLQDSMVVMAEIERRQPRILLHHSERIVSLEEQIADDRRQSALFQRRTDPNLAEITDKLNGLIGSP